MKIFRVDSTGDISVVIKKRVDSEWTDVSETHREIVDVAPQEGSMRRWNLMADDSVEIQFSHEDYIEFKIGDFIFFDNERFLLIEDYKPDDNSETEGYNYVLSFKADYMLANNRIFKLSGKEESWSLHDTLITHTDLWRDALIEYGICHRYTHEVAESGTTYTQIYEVDFLTNVNDYTPYTNENIRTIPKSMTYQQIYCVDAITKMAETWKCEWWRTRIWDEENGWEKCTFQFGRCEYSEDGEAVDLHRDYYQGQEGNIVSIEGNGNENRYATRIYPYGSNKNLPARYDKSLIFSQMFRSTQSTYTDFRDSARELSFDMFDDEDKTYPTGVSSSITGAEDFPDTFNDDSGYEKEYTFAVSHPGKVKMRFQGQLKITKTYGESYSFTASIGIKSKHIGKVFKYQGQFQSNEQNKFFNFDETIKGICEADDFITINVKVSQYVQGGNWYGSRGGYYFDITSQPEMCQVNTILHFKDSDTDIACVINPNNLNEDAEGHDTIRVLNNVYQNKQFTLPNIIESQVPLSYYTSDLIGYAERRLHLDSSNGSGTGYIKRGLYIQDADTPDDKVKEEVVIFDDVEPNATLKVSAVRSYTEVEKTEEGDKTHIYYLVQLQMKNGDNWVTFSFNEDWNKNYDPLSVKFQSGSLNGLDFKVNFYPNGLKGSEGYQEFEIIAQDVDNIEFPNSTAKPAVGDMLVLYNWDTSYIANMGFMDNAVADLLSRSIAYLNRSKIDQNTYTVPMMSNWVYNRGLVQGVFDYDKAIFKIGQKVNLRSQQLGGSRESRVIGMEVKVDLPYDTPQYSIGENVDYTYLNDSGTKEVTNLSPEVVESEGNGSSLEPMGNKKKPVFINDSGKPQIITGLDVPEYIRSGKNIEAMWGVAAHGIATLEMGSSGGGGTVTGINFAGSPSQIYTPSEGLITLPDYPTAASLISDGLASQSYVQSYFSDNFTQANIKSTLGISDWALAGTKPSYNFSEIGSKPTTLAGYGITDAHITNGVVTLGGNTITPATLTNGKIPLSQIPDAILGQLIYGGTVNGSGVVTLSQNAKDKWGITSLTLTSTNYSTYEGAFFIASADATSGVPSTLGLLVGDWVVATASGWGKIDNTDAVTGVKGDAESSYRIGNVNITKGNIGLGNVENTALSTWAGTSNITTLGTITTGVWHGTAIGYDYLASGVQTSLGKADTVRGYFDTNGLLNKANHYSPASDSSADYSASATGATAAWSIDVVKGVQIQRDAKGHILGVTVTSGKIPAKPSYAFSDLTSHPTTLLGYGITDGVNGLQKSGSGYLSNVDFVEGNPHSLYFTFTSFAKAQIGHTGGTGSTAYQVRVKADGAWSDYLALQQAGASAWGIVTDQAQTFGGDKTFNGNIHGMKGVSARGIATLEMAGGGGAGTVTSIQFGSGTVITANNGLLSVSVGQGTSNGQINIGGQDISVKGLAALAYLPSLAFGDLTTHPTTLGGYGITDAKIANGVITLGSNSITPLTGINASMINTALGFTLSGTSGQTYNLATISSNASNGNTAYGYFSNGVLPASKGGTGKTSLSEAGSAIINALGEGSSPATRNDYIVAQYAGGGTTITSYYRRKLSNIFAALNSGDITTALGYTPYNATNPNGYISGNQTITLSGDVSGSGATSIAVTIGAGKVTNAMLAGSIANNKLVNSSISIAGTSVSLGGSISAATLKSNLGLGASAYLGYDTTVTKDSTKLITSGAVWTAIDNLPEPMVFKGSLGTGGTITALPVNGSASIGDTYKVITAGTYASKAAKVGDTFICLTKTSSANTWELIPSGDEPSGTVTSVGLSMPTGFSVSSSPVTSSGTLTVAFASGYSLPTTAKQSNWDTAYGWGNHANAGYLLASTAANTYLPLSGGTMTGALGISTKYWENQLILNRINNTTNWGATIVFKRDGNYDTDLMAESGHLYVSGDAGNSRKKVWDEANDGSGSGLDADLLDGQEGSYYAAASSLSNYLPLSGGTLSSSSFGTQLIIERTGSANAASIGFKNSNGILGYLATNSVDGAFVRYNAAANNAYTILDSSNSSVSLSGSGSTLTVEINGTSKSLTNTWRPLGYGATDAAYGNHLYHKLTSGAEYFDNYNGYNLLNMVTETMARDTLRFRASSVSNVQYWNYDTSAWATWTNKVLSPLFDGNPNNQIGIPFGRRKFRFQITASTGYPSTALFMMQGSWYNWGSFTPFENGKYIHVIIETRSTTSDEFVEKSNFYFSNSVAGKNVKVIPSVLHTGETLYRITIELCGWTNTSNEANLSRVCLLSNFGGLTLDQAGYDGNGNHIPLVNDSYTLGNASFKWKNVYATTFTENGTALSSKYLGINANAVSATKLATARNIWGQSFNGSANISGDMSNVGNIAFQASGKNIGGLLYFDTTNGRLGVGVTSPLYKLHVGGDIVANGGVAARGIVTLDTSGAGISGAVTQINVGSTPYTPTDGIVSLPASFPASDVSAWAKASSRPTYTTSIETSTGTNQRTLAFGTKYALNAGDTSYIFTMPSLPSASTSAAGVVQLSSATNSTSASLAATASAVKAAYDLASEKASKRLAMSTSTASSLTMSASTDASYIYWYSNSVTSVSLAQATSAISADSCGTVHYILFRNVGTSQITVTLSKYNNSNYQLISPAKSFVIPASSSVEISYVHFAASALRMTVVTIGDIMSDIS